jgi:hypothetical protein
MLVQKALSIQWRGKGKGREVEDEDDSQVQDVGREGGFRYINGIGEKT